VILFLIITEGWFKKSKIEKWNRSNFKRVQLISGEKTKLYINDEGTTAQIKKNPHLWSTNNEITSGRNKLEKISKPTKMTLMLLRLLSLSF